MNLTLEPVEPGNLAQFLRYCAQYGPEHDESYLPGEDFVISADRPSYLLLEEGKAVGAVSLMRTPAYVQARRGRFAILHARVPATEPYAALYQAISQHFDGLDQVYLFAPTERHDTAGILRELGFGVERYSFVLSLRDPQPRAMQFEEGFEVVALRPQDGAAIQRFVELVNSNFRQLAGHVELSAQDVQGWFREASQLENGICLLVRGEEAVGTVCITRDLSDEGASEITALGVAEGFRGRGLGRQLLRYAVNFSVSHGLKPVYLSVNGENHLATRLYITEGFMLEQTVVCYAKDVQEAGNQSNR